VCSMNHGSGRRSDIKNRIKNRNNHITYNRIYALLVQLFNYVELFIKLYKMLNVLQYWGGGSLGIIFTRQCDLRDFSRNRSRTSRYIVNMSSPQLLRTSGFNIPISRYSISSRKHNVAPDISELGHWSNWRDSSGLVSSSQTIGI